MVQKFSTFLDRFSEFYAHRKGLLPLLGMLLIALNFALQLFASGWLIQTNCFLHLGIVLAILGFMIARAL
jgi:hypothetical protein